MSIFAIGDIHGCFNALETLMEAVSPAADDELIFLGDYVDRGPNSAHVIEYILQLPESQRTTLLGNHEIMMLEFRAQVPDSSRWVGYGGAETLASYGIRTVEGWTEAVPDTHWQFLEELDHYHYVEDHVFVHATVQPHLPLLEQSPQSLFWDKLDFNQPPYEEGLTVICGHTAQRSGQILDLGHTICIDTCAYAGQWLTCLNVEWRQYWQANQKGEVREGRLRS